MYTCRLTLVFKVIHITFVLLQNIKNFPLKNYVVSVPPPQTNMVRTIWPEPPLETKHPVIFERSFLGSLPPQYLKLYEI